MGNRRLDRPRVLLLWPGGLLGARGNFGVPQLLGLAAAIRKEVDAVVDVVDLDMERAFGPVDIGRLCDPGYDLVGISCYSSFDYLKVMAIAERVRARLPRAWIATGGYHPSARPGDFTGDGTPFDYVVVGDGERPLARLARALATGKRPLERVLGPDAVPDPGELVPYDWSLLDRYRGTARRFASQAEIYLSRGCPYDCAFCMERAKRDVSWRALEPGQAIEEMHRLDRFLDLSRWTLFVADALFGMKRSWRRSFLTELARRPLRARKVWLLIRVDLIEREDFELMARANVAPGFGLESGDPDQLRLIRKAGKLDDYLEKMIEVSEWAREANVPFGANIIVGHPGETEARMRTSARYMERLFLGAKGTHGFLSVDPFRLYPGSAIDEERERWERDTGMRAHRYPWWHDGDPNFLSEWVDPSRELDFRRAQRLRHELFDPIVREIPRRFAYTGPARDYFMRAIEEQVALTAPRRSLDTLGLWHLWSGALRGSSDADVRRAVRDDVELGEVARAARVATLGASVHPTAPAMRGALERVRRELHVSVERIGESAQDVAIATSDDGRSSVSALHAYAMTFDLLSLSEGDHLVDLGGGTGYGAAVAAEVVGVSGSVTTIEIDPGLSALAQALLAERKNVRVVWADAHDVSGWRGASKVACGFAVDVVPAAWLDALAVGGVLVAPVVRDGAQVLVRHVKRATGVVDVHDAGVVRYVGDRGCAPVSDVAPAPAPA